MRAIETTITVDADGATRLDHPIQIVPGRHRAVLVIDEAEAVEPKSQESWPEFINRTFGSLADLDFDRQPQGDYEQRSSIE